MYGHNTPFSSSQTTKIKHVYLLSWIHTEAKSTWTQPHCNGCHVCNPTALQPQTACHMHVQFPPGQLGKLKCLQEAPQDGLSLLSPQPEK